MMRGYVVKGLRSQVCDLDGLFLFWVCEIKTVKKSTGMNRLSS